MQPVAEAAASILAPQSIEELQRSFAAALFRSELAVPAAVAGRSEPQRNKRFNVYRNNVYASLAAALAARFPVVERLVGAEFFRAMALIFIERHPPTSPVLAEYGGELPIFLRTFEPARGIAYLADVARLEWARNVAYHAADAETIAIGVLGALPPEAVARATLQLHPAACVIASTCPIVAIWLSNTHDDAVETITADRTDQIALVTRPVLNVLVTLLPVGAEGFFASLAEGLPLANAARRAIAGDAKFDLSSTLALLFDAGAVTSLTFPNSATEIEQP